MCESTWEDQQEFIIDRVPFFVLASQEWDEVFEGDEGDPVDFVGKEAALRLALLGLGPKSKAPTLRDRYQKTNQITKGRANKCHTRETKHNLRSLLWTYETKCGESYSSRKGWIQHFQIMLGRKFGQSRENIKGKLFRDLKVGVRCTCPAFVYWSSERLAQKGDYLLSEPRGLIKAPTRNFFFADGSSVETSYLCKHLMIAGRHFGSKKL